MAHFFASYTIWCLFFGSLAATAALTPLVMLLARRVGAVDGGGHRKVYQGRPMPLLGGVAVALPFIAACLMGALGLTQMFRVVESQIHSFIALAIGCGAIVALGVIDDAIGMRARWKLLGQIIIAGFICVAGHTIGKIEIPGLGLITVRSEVGTLLTILWIVGLTNAYNLVDGIDGLAAGLALISSLGLGFIAMMNGMFFPALLCTALAGSLIAFLFYNFNPARIFLGDTGSMFLGFVLANIALMSSLKSSGAAIVLAPVLVMGLPIFDMLSSMLRRYLRGRPIFSGDQGHIHHRLLRRGYSARRVALTLYLFAGVMAVTAICATLPGGVTRWAGGLSYAATGLALIWLCGFLAPTSLRHLRLGRQRNTVLNAFSRYTALKLGNIELSTDGNSQHILWLICQELRLRRIEVATQDGERLLSHEHETGDGASGEGESDASALPGPAQADLHCRILNRSGQMLEVTYASEGLPEGLEAHDVESCLARILEEADLKVVETFRPKVTAKQEVALSGERIA